MCISIEFQVTYKGSAKSLTVHIKNCTTGSPCGSLCCCTAVWANVSTESSCLSRLTLPFTGPKELVRRNTAQPLTGPCASLTSTEGKHILFLYDKICSPEDTWGRSRCYNIHTNMMEGHWTTRTTSNFFLDTCKQIIRRLGFCFHACRLYASARTNLIKNNFHLNFLSDQTFV